MQTKNILDTIINIARPGYSDGDHERLKQSALGAVDRKGATELELMARDGRATIEAVLESKSATSEDFTRAAIAAAAADRLHDMKSSADVFSRLDTIPAGGAHASENGTKGLFTDDDAKRLVSTFKTGQPFKTNIRFGRKAPILGDTGSGFMVPATGNYVAPGLMAGAHVSLADLMTPKDANGPVERYYIMSGGSVGVVAEGAPKPDAGVDPDFRDGELVKLASTFRYSDELGEDAGFLVPKITEEVVRATLVAENAQIVAAWAGASGHQTETAAAATVVDDLLDAITLSEAYVGVLPTHIIANPVQVATIRKAKASTAGSYHIDPQGGPTSLAGIPVLSTAAVPAGKVYILSGREHGVFYRRGPLRIEAGHSGNDFAENMVTVRVEERVLPAITQPHRVMEVTVS